MRSCFAIGNSSSNCSFNDDRLFGVLDIDAPMINRFTEADEKDFEEIVKILIKKIEAIDK